MEEMTDGVRASDPFYTVEEYAERLKVSRGTVFGWLRNGMPSVCVGRTRRIVTDRADAWLAAGGAAKRRSKRTKRPAPAP